MTAEPVPFAFDSAGAARVGGTRVTLEVLLGCYLNGETVEQLHEDFPSVPLSEIHATIAYYWRHRPEVDAYLAEVAEVAEEAAAVMRELERDFPQDGLKARLLARMQERNGSTGRPAAQGGSRSMSDSIVSDPGILGGKPCVRGTRLSVAFILELAASGADADRIAAAYPELTPETVADALRYAARFMANEVEIAAIVAT